MERQVTLSDLRIFAEKSLAAERHPDDFHIFHLFECDVCGVVPLALTIEHHSGSKAGDFKGVIYAQCSRCGSKRRVFSFTSEHRKCLREERPACRCGNKYFFVGECERIEGDEGLLGFFDEGVVVGKCSRCERSRAFVYTD
jgi:hypothetical protein